MTRPPLKDDQQFRLVFPGNVLPGANYDEVVFDLARLLKTSPDKAIRLVSGKRRHVKRSFIYEKADQLRVQVLNLGVECELEPVNSDMDSKSKSNKKKRKKSFPKPDDVAMKATKMNQISEDVPVGGKSYSQKMAEYQEHANANDSEKAEGIDFDEAGMDFNSEKVKTDSKKIKGVSKENKIRRLALFLGDNIDEYLAQFSKFDKDGAPHFVFTWHWPAFLVPFFWAIYRKLWLWSVVILISSVFFPLTNFLWGTVAYYIYYKHSLKKINRLRKHQHSNVLDDKLKEQGGTSTMAVSGALLAILLFMNGVYWTAKFSPVFSTLNQNLEAIEKNQQTE